MRQRKKENGRRKNCKELRGKKLKMQACIMENMKVGNRLCTIPNPPPLHPSSHVLSLWHWEQRFGGDKLRYFISDVTNARCCYRVCSSFFRMDGRNKDRPRLCRHHGFGSVLRRAVSYQLINFLYKSTALGGSLWRFSIPLRINCLDNYRAPPSLKSHPQFRLVKDH